jgi:hypothetical protein
MMIDSKVSCGAPMELLLINPRCPKRHADAGEAENIWPRFCADFERGSPQPLYREAGVVALAGSISF